MTIRFESFRLDEADERLWKGDDVVPLTPRAFAVLRHLVAHPGRLVTKDELLDAVWGEVAVTDSVLKVAVAEIRRALDDPAREPRFVETVHRRGYRFIASLEGAGTGEAGRASLANPPPVRLFGREAELALLDRALGEALAGKRQVVFVTGEPGIGKTSLADAALERARARGARVARGQCVELLAAGEPYGPVFEALGRLCRAADGEAVTAELLRLAPTWLVHMPGVGTEAQRRRLGAEVLGAGRERMLRELGEAFVAIAAKRSLVLVLEDLHWSDSSTVDLLAALARGREAARLLVIGTLRPVDLILAGHPLKGVRQELEAHRLCREIPLGGLAEDAVAAWLADRFGEDGLPSTLVPALVRRTDGNPLFVASTLDDLVTRQVLCRSDERWELRAAPEEIEADVPESVRGIVERRLDRLDDEQRRILETASAAGGDFSAAVVARVLDADPLRVEEICEALVVRHGFLRRAGRSRDPERRRSGRFGVVHAIHRHVLYEGISPGRRARLHARIGDAREDAWGARAGEIAAELALHFDRAGMPARAIVHLRRAAANAASRAAWAEALETLEGASALAASLPAPERAVLELAILEERAATLRASGDLFGAASAYEALLERARREGDQEAEAEGFFGLVTVLYWLDRRRALDMVNAGLELAGRSSLDRIRLHMPGLWGQWNLQLTGWREEFVEAFERGLVFARASGDRRTLCAYLVQQAYTWIHRSEYRRAVAAADEGIGLALELGEAYFHMIGQFFRAWALLNLGDLGEMLRVVEDGLEHARRNGNAIGERIFLFEKAWLYEEALDPETALAIAEPALAEAWEGQFDQFTGLLAVAASRLSAGDLAGARECLAGIAGRLERDPLAADWIFRMPFGLRLGALALAEGDPGGARERAAEVVALAEGPGERMYLALGRRLLAEAALAEGDLSAAAAEAGRALAVLDGGEAPLALWRTAETAARIAARRGRKGEAARLRERASSALAPVAESLEGHPQIRARLLAAAGELPGGSVRAPRIRSPRARRSAPRATRR